MNLSFDEKLKYMGSICGDHDKYIPHDKSAIVPVNIGSTIRCGGWRMTRGQMLILLIANRKAEKGLKKSNDAMEKFLTK